KSISYYRISIPIWCDWKAVQLCFCRRSEQISIPIWCDWKWDRTLYHLLQRLFQFLYGAIGRKFDHASSLQKQNFNSYMVRLEVADYFKRQNRQSNFNSYMVRLEDETYVSTPKFYMISIPIWCDWKPRIIGRRI